MRIHALALAVAATASLLTGQSPLTTFYASNNGGGVGGGVYFDLTVNAPVMITGVDASLSSTASGTIDWLVRPAPGTWVNNITSSVGWTLMGSGPVTGAGTNIASPCVFTTPFLLTPGAYGVALCHNSVAARYTNGTGTNQTHSNAELTLQAGGAQNTCLSATTIFTPRVFNGSIHYLPGANAALATPYGAGCYDHAVSYYETFAANAFDLAGSATAVRSLLMVPTGGGYIVVPGSGSWFTPTSANLGLANEASVLRTLPFPLPYPGGTTTDIRICPNGYVWLSANTLSDPTPTAQELLTQGPRFCPMWMDLNPATAGTVHYDVDAPSGNVYVTWLGVAENGATGSANTMQLVLSNSGLVEYRWRALRNTLGAGLVGWSPGANNRDPGGLDISAAQSFVTNPDNLPLRLRALGRPVLGSSPSLVTSDIPAGTSVGAVVFSNSRITPAISLGGIGMPECFQHVGSDVSLIFTVTGATATFPLTIPSDPSFAGVLVRCQTATFSTGFNALGILSSNGLELLLDTQ